MTSVTPTEHRLQLHRAGYQPLPVNGKNPDCNGKGWQDKRQQTNQAEIRLWEKLYPHAENTGVLTRSTPFLDIDILDPEAADAVLELVKERFDGEPILARVGKPPKMAIPFRASTPFRKITREFAVPAGERIEFLADGSQVVVDGIHPDTGKPYRWHGANLWDTHRDKLPEITGEAAQALVDDITALLVGNFGFQTKKGGAGTRSARSDAGAFEWALTPGNLIDHDKLAAGAMALLKSGMGDGNLINFLRASVDGLPDVNEERRGRRLAEIPGIVATARAKLQAQKHPEGWPDPDLSVLRPNRRPPPPLPLDVFGDRWSNWIVKAAQSAACPPDFVASTLLAAASSLIGHARWPAAHAGWSEPPHLWAVNVGDSGDGKSPGADPIARHIMPRLEDFHTAGFQERRRARQAEIDVAKARHDAWKADVRDAVKEGRTPPLSPPEAPEDLVEPRLVFGDITVERVATLLAQSASKGVLLMRDEIAGWLLGMNAYNDAARQFWLEAYGGRPYRVDRVKHPRPIHLERLAVSWHGGIQPSRLAEIMRQPDDGLLARIVWFWPDPVPFAMGHQAPDLQWATEALDRLRGLELGGDNRPVVVPLEENARAKMEELGGLLQDKQKDHAGLMNSALGKGRGLALRLALVLLYLQWCAAPWGEPPASIPLDAFTKAARFVIEYALPMAERTYGDAACTTLDRNTTTLARWIAKERPPEVHVRHVQRDVRLAGLSTAGAIQAACEALAEAGWLGEPPAGRFQQRGRKAYPVSPRLAEALR